MLLAKAGRRKEGTPAVSRLDREVSCFATEQRGISSELGPQCTFGSQASFCSGVGAETGVDRRCLSRFSSGLSYWRGLRETSSRLHPATSCSST